MFERGFKSWCENFALKTRKELKLIPVAPLSSQALASYLQIRLLTPKDIPNLPHDAISVLMTDERWNWSAVTISHNGIDAIVYNPSHSIGRQSSDIMHEISHVVLGHDPAKIFISQDKKMAIRTHDRGQEQEASWLAGCLLLPRPALISIGKSAMSNLAICQKYGVTEDMLFMRQNVTGVATQLSRYAQR